MIYSEFNREQGEYKVIDPEILALSKRDSLEKEIIVRKLGMIVLEMGLMVKPKTTSTLNNRNNPRKYSNALASTIKKMMNNYITIQGVHQEAE